MRPLLGLVLFALIVVAGCAPAGDIRVAEPIGTIQPPSFELVPGFTSIDRFDPPGTGTDLELTIGTLIRNPNDFGVTVDRISYRVRLTGVEVATGVLEEPVYLEPGATAPVRFEIATGLDRRPRLLRAILAAFADEPVPFEVHGQVRFSSPSYAFETRDRLLVAGATLARQSLEQPRVDFDEASSRVYLVQANVPVVQVVLQIENPGDIGYFLYGRDLELSLGGAPLGLEDLPPTPIPAGQSQQVTILFYPVVERLSASAATALDAALAGIPTLLQIQGELRLDVLGVDTYDVTPPRILRGFIDADR